MNPRARIHAMLALDETTAQELDRRLNALVAETVQDVLWQVGQSAGDEAAEAVRDHYPHLEAWLRGETVETTEEPRIDMVALAAEADAQRAQQCACEHIRGAHIVLNGRGVCQSCNCRGFTRLPRNGQ
ncbi:hypothetical protein ACFZB5_13590 [Streptomyces nodosus]|uniref:hypothetical protein n=1 Tax=Streptomyces nodosus TaxID=40318 RepID=UPI0036E2BB6B